MKAKNDLNMAKKYDMFGHFETDHECNGRSDWQTQMHLTSAAQWKLPHFVQCLTELRNSPI